VKTEVCDAEARGWSEPLERDSRDPGGVGEESGSAGAPAATWAQLWVVFTCSSSSYQIHAERLNDLHAHFLSLNSGGPRERLRNPNLEIVDPSVSRPDQRR
jgi:hypothetical protein